MVAMSEDHALGVSPTERIVEGVHLPSVQRNVFLGVVRGGGAGCEALRNRLLDVRRVVFA